MRTFQSIAVAILSLYLTACNGQNKQTQQTADRSVSRIEVLDFHSTHRCMTCNAIEANTEYTLKTYFTDELKSKKITFQTINVDKEENEKIAEKFQASGTALILNVISKGKETHVDLTDFAFMKGNDKEAFSKALKAKIEQQLKAL